MKNKRRHQDQRGVPVLAQDVALIPGVPVVIERQRVRPRKEPVLNGIGERPEGRENRPDDRHQPDEPQSE